MVNNLTKVFIKISSWLLGRPSGTPDMVLGVKDGAIVKGVLTTQSIPVLEEIPDADASKAGQQFWLNGTLWTYARAGQFGTLAEGEPWPVKGYKDIIIFFNSNNAQEVSNFGIKIDDFGISDFLFDSDSLQFIDMGVEPSSLNYVVSGNATTTESDSASLGNVKDGNFNNFLAIISRPKDISIGGVISYNIFIKIYPPTT